MHRSRVYFWLHCVLEESTEIFNSISIKESIMRDAHSIPLIDQLHPKVRADFKAFIEECEEQFNLAIRIISAMRTMEEQEKIYAQGRTAPGAIVTKAPPGSSYHNWGLAVDIAPLSVSGEVNYNYDQGKWVGIASQWNITWGGSWAGFKDLDHWENKMGHNWRDLLDLYNAKKFIENTQFVDI